MPQAATHDAYSLELRDIREALGLTQIRFSELLGCCNNTLSRYETGYYRVPETVIRLARRIYLDMEGGQ